MENSYVIGVDFGSDSVRAMVVETQSGKEISTAVSNYRRWSEGKYCNPSVSQFRQHPLDYLESLEYVLKNVVKECPEPDKIRAIGVDTTASTPALCDKYNTPLALLPGLEENPNAMFVLWKDHTGQQEANLFNQTVKNSDVNYLLHCGSHCSAEYFWPKALHTLKSSVEISSKAEGAIECCDWITAVLTGHHDLPTMAMSHCAANIKKQFSPRWNGFPPKEFFDKLDTELYKLVENQPTQSTDIDKPAGTLCKEWAEKTGLSTDTIVCTGIIDSYSGAIGGGVRDGSVVLNLGTSQCQMAVRERCGLTGKTIDGIFGEADDTIIPGYEGLEAGISAFGDLYAWFKRIVAWPLRKLAAETSDESLKSALAKAEDNILADLSEEALKLNITLDSPLATDYINGRRTPKPQNDLSGAIMGLRISTSAPEMFYAFAEASAFATKAVLDLYINNGVNVKQLIAIGGIAVKSPLVTQLISDLTQLPVEVSASGNNCALGAAIAASVAAGIYPSMENAQDAMCPPISKTYYPNPEKAELLGARYIRYQALGDFTELVLLSK